MNCEFTESSKKKRSLMRSSKLPDGAITSAEETRGYQFTNGEYAEFSSISEKEKQL